MNLYDNFTTLYADRPYAHTALVRHKGTMIAFAIANNRRIYYTVLDLDRENASPLDKENWLRNPQELQFSNEIAKVGYGIIDPTPIPVYKKNGELVAAGESIREEEKDAFLSSTAQLSAPVPFQVLSDDKYIYLFRQGGEFTNLERQQGIPEVESTLLVDRFVLVGTELKRKLEVRYQRSRNKFRPQNRKDTLGSKDMEGNSFYEPTQQLDMVKNLINGRFSVLLLPTKLPEVQCWQIFAYNKATEQIESLNIERSKDGLFNLQGMPATSTTGAAKSGLKFNGNGYVELPNVVNSDSGTLEFWVKFASLEDQILVDASTTFNPIGNADPILNVKYFYLAIANQKLRFGFEDATDKDFVLNAEQPVPSTRYWHHVAVSWNYKTSAGTAIAQLYLNGQLVGQLKDDKLAGPKPTLSSLFFGKIRPADNKGQPEHKSTAPFKGKIDEIRCWSVARTEADLSASLHRRLQGNEPGLVGYWRCDDGAGTRVTDRALHSEIANANHGSIHGAVAWTWSDAPIETTEVSQTGFKIDNCGIASGISALLYYQQEEGSTGYDNEPKPLKKNARVMLTVGVRRAGEAILDVAAIDFGVSRNGKLAELPSVIELPSIASGEQPMPLQTIDSTGLSVSGAILRFAQFRSSPLNSIESAPLLFESANGRIALYFAAQDEKFSVAYYDPLTAKANYSLDASSVVPVGKLARSLSGTVAQFSLVRSGDAVRRSISAGATLKLGTTPVTVKERVAKDATTVAIEPIQLTDSIPEGTAISLVEAGSITLVARTAGSLLDSATIVVENGSTPTTCTITLESTALGIKEVWQDVPRHAEKFVRVLNGAASTDETDPYYYDYANVDVVEGPNSNPALGSLLFVAVNDRPQGEVANTPAARPVTDSPTRSARWIADVPSQAMRFDGQDDYLAIAASSFKKLNSDNDLTLEAWIKPTNIDKTASVIHYHHDSDYTLGLLANPPAALEFNNLRGDNIEISNPFDFNSALTHFTISLWVNPAELNWSDSDQRPVRGLFGYSFSTLRGPSLWLEAGSGGLHYESNSKGSPSDPQQPFYGTVQNFFTAAEQWVHIAWIKDLKPDGTSEYRFYRNGILVDTQPAPLSFFPSSHDSHYTIGGVVNVDHSQFNSFWKGKIAEVAVWQAARSEAEIRADMNQHLRGNEPNLLSYYQFGEGPDKPLAKFVEKSLRPFRKVHGSPSLTTSPLPLYSFFARVGNQFVKARKSLPLSEWAHIAAVFNQSYALQFDGAADTYLNCGSNATLNISGDLTIEVDLQLDDLSYPRGILSKGALSDGTDEDVPYLLYVDVNGSLTFCYEKENTVQRFSGGKLEAGKFYKIAVTRRYVSTPTNSGATSGEIIKLFVDGVQVSQFSGTSAGGNNQPLTIGKAYHADGYPISFKGVISDVRLWSVARDPNDLSRRITGAEKGLVSWWRFEERQGNVAYDSNGSNHATRSGAKWVKNPDRTAPAFLLYHNGVTIATELTTAAALQEPSTTPNQFMLGARLKTPAGSTTPTRTDFFQGELDEVRLWKTVRTQEQIQDNLLSRLVSEKSDLLAYYAFDATGGLNDLSLQGNHLTSDKPPTLVPSGAPVGKDIPQVRNVLAGLATALQETIVATPSVQEYGDLQADSDGNLIGVMKRCYAYIKNNQWHLITGYKVGNLVTEWIGQVQGNPQLIGFIEGAPPVPSENLTENLGNDYRGASAIELTEADSLTYIYSSTEDKGNDTLVEGKIAAGVDAEFSAGVGAETKVGSLKLLAGYKHSYEASTSQLKESSITYGRNTSRTSRMDLQGYWENEATKLSRVLGKRFIPQNVGFALVQSDTMDLFALRLEHNNALVSYQMRPNPDIPKDWNIIHFPINPQYTKQGTLDGKVGFKEDGSVQADPDYPTAATYGEWSYFKPKEAYALKNQIDRATEELKNYYENYSTSVGASSSIDLPKEELKKLAKRNLVNTYVWTAEGGFFAESTELMEATQEVIGGSYSMSNQSGLSVSVEASVTAVAAAFELDALFGQHLSLTKAKSQETEKSFGLSVEVGTERDLQQFDENGDRKYDPGTNQPILVPGKVDAYRFMTFYLEPSLNNFDDFANRVVDPVWLAESKQGNAIALREALQTQRQAGSQDKSLPWRVMHRVTFVSRILPSFVPNAEAPPLQKAMKDANIDSNWQLIKKLEPFVRSKTGVDFDDAVRDAVKAYAQELPELQSHVEEIIEYMRLYFQVPDEV